jgi:Protein of unknown function (DUF3303)
MVGSFDIRNVRSKLTNMLFMVIEYFKRGDARPVGEWFRRSGRMLPEGAAYHGSWVDSKGARYFQVMEAPNREFLDLWVSRWDDLVEFDIVPVQTSADFWSKVERLGRSENSPWRILKAKDRMITGYICLSVSGPPYTFIN